MPINTNRYSSMVHEYYVQRVRAIFDKRQAARAKIKTRKDALRLQAQVRKAVAAAFGPMPEKTPLNARTTGRLEHETYTIEKIVYESRPGFFVTGSLYVPKNLRGPAPAVLLTCGHAGDAKAFKEYQPIGHAMAMKGFVVLVIDPISQAERVQYPDDKGLPSIGLCQEHTMIGQQQSLIGEFFGAWRAWDGIRGVDYLVSRPEVDPTRIGLTGQSGGGTMTTWITALEPRLAMSAPACYITTMLANLENENGADAEQIPPGLLGMGLDQSDLLIAHAPKPLIILSVDNDFFDHRGTVQAYEQLLPIWRVLGKPENLRLMTGPGTHAYSPELREAMYGFFGKHAGVKAPAKEPAVTLHAEAELWATPEGSTIKAGSKRVFDFTKDWAAQVDTARKPVSARKLPKMLSELLVLPARSSVVHHRMTQSRDDGKYRWQYFSLQTEPGIQAIVTMALPPQGHENRVPVDKECTLVVPHQSAWEEMSSGVLGDNFPHSRKRIFGVDYRGVGESSPSTGWGGNPLDILGNDYFFNSHGLLLAEPFLGRRVHDVLCTIDWLRGHGYRNIHMIGRGVGSVVGLLAATVDCKLASVTLMSGLLSWVELTQIPISAWNSSCLLRDGLRHFDLPDCLRALGGKLTLVRPWDAQMTPMPADVVRQRIAQMGLTCKVDV